MKFDIDRMYTALNADKLKVGDMVITADSYYQLKSLVEASALPNGEIFRIADESENERFITTAMQKFAFAYA